MVCFNFFNFIAIFLEFSISRWVGTKWNDNFYFLPFSSFSYLFWLEKNAYRYFLNFLNFLIFFLNFLLRVGLEQNVMIIFILSLSHPFQTYFGLKRIHNCIFYFFEFFAIFLEFSITRRVVTKRNDNFYFVSFSSFSNLFWLEMKP